MAEKKQASFADLNFDQIAKSDDYTDSKAIPKSRFSNAIKCILFAILGIGLGAGLFSVLFYLI